MESFTWLMASTPATIKKEKSPPKYTNYIPRTPINLTRNQPPRKCKIIRRVIKHGDLYGAY